MKKNKFNLLIAHGDTVRKVTFEEGKDKKIIGIFPFSYSPIFLFADESGLRTRLGADSNSLPYIGFWKSLIQVKNELNKALTELNIPIIEGDYFTSSNYSSDQNLIVTIKGDKISSEYADESKKAKLRYVNIYEER